MQSRQIQKTKQTIHPAVSPYPKWQRETLTKSARSLVCLRQYLMLEGNAGEWNSPYWMLLLQGEDYFWKFLPLFFFWFPLMRASKLLYYDRAGVSKGTLAGGTQFGTPNDLKKLYAFQGERFSSFCCLSADKRSPKNPLASTRHFTKYQLNYCNRKI